MVIGGGGMEGHKDGRKNRQMDGRMDGWKYRLTSGNPPLCSTGDWPFGAAAQKGGTSDAGSQYCCGWASNLQLRGF